MDYIWDTVKDSTNQKKHGISFTQAAIALEDENRLEEYDLIHSTLFEDRYSVICLFKNEIVLFVTCLFISPEITRIISARKGTRKEIERYYDQANIIRRA